ncbi:MAG: polymerase [Thermoleophilaceae bacterium]|jgi:DNA polymerase (family 10)|nr:polymerase [Thermoleophilaceae bacterium]MEA2352774.1 polymerase [Thermoleophilaceae bacterium]
MRNAEVALHFDELADLYELDGAISYRVLAYRNAAKSIREANASVEEMTKAGRVTELAGIGKTIAEKLEVLFETGEIPAAQKLKAKYPPGLVEITRLPGFGPKRARKVFDELGIASLDELREAAENERLRAIPGFGPKAEETVLVALDAGLDDRTKPRLLLSRAKALAESLAEALREHPAAERVEIAGSARRWTDTCKDLDLVATAGDPAALAEAFGSLPLIGEVHSSGPAGVRAVTHNGMSIDLRIVAPEAFGNLLQHFTGSKQHNEALRADAVRRGLHVSEYGIADDSTGTTHACATEEEVYELLGLAWVEPELRENRGEIQAARDGALPDLIRLEDLRGELHCHTVASDGRNTIEEMAAAAIERGYEYIAITDHSATHGFGNDVQPDELRRQIERIHELDAATDGIRILAGSEVNVLPDGSLDYEDGLLAELDWVMASLHSSFRMGEREQTERMIRAMEHPLVDAIGHPTGRLIDRREPYALDIEAVAKAAARTGTFLEINGNPDRRDLNEVNVRMAVEAGATIVIDSDGHGTETLANVAYGVATARRAWLTAANVANTRSWDELDALRSRSRADVRG